MQNVKKKTAIAAATAAGVLAVGGAAFAYISVTGSGNGTATATADTSAVVLEASGSIGELDTDTPLTIEGKAPSANRHIGAVTVSIGNIPTGCKAEWFKLSNGTASNTGTPGSTTGPTISTTSPFTGYTFTTDTKTPVPSHGLKIALVNDPLNDQTPCLGKSIPLTVTSVV